jgi:4-amino-4-deoxy-L-arabinose transferase-like glycosyltransferase
MQTYKHRQFGTLMVTGLGAGILMLLLILFRTPPGPAIIITVLVSLLVLSSLLLFWSLTVEVKSDHTLVYFGFGIIHRKISLSEIQQVNVVRTPWYYGWGIRPAPHGWMFNVSGFGGVELIFKNNERFRIGSDEPMRLAEAIQNQLLVTDNQ